MKIVSIIGTRPQYIKVKPISYRCNEMNIEHLIADTNQHYSHNVSKAIIEDLGIHIYKNLKVKNINEINFITNCINNIYSFLKIERPDFILVYGDTNSTFAASIVAYKMHIKLAHIESGLRCNNINIPEEVNRIFTDMVSNLNFCSTHEALDNVGNGIYSGDLEYELLNKIVKNIEYSGEAVLTLHRQENMLDHKLNIIFDLCSRINYPIIFPIHHRTDDFIKRLNLNIPNNIKIIEPCNYSGMTELLAKCKFIITDSGGIQKVAPFFGKKCLVTRKESEWKDVIKSGYSKLADFSNEDIQWLNDFKIKVNKNFYMRSEDPSKIIIKKILES
jgi:UDP-N-acetylglucosamine 2-epimerase